MLIAPEHNEYPYGNAAFADADIIALAESWAEQIGLTFSDMTYHTNQQTSINTTYNKRLERTWNEMPKYIPHREKINEVALACLVFLESIITK